MAPVVVAAGLTALGALMSSVMQQRAAKEEAARREKLEREMDAKNRLDRAQQNQLQIAQRMGENEQGALQQLMGVLARSQR